MAGRIKKECFGRQCRYRNPREAVNCRKCGVRLDRRGVMLLWVEFPWPWNRSGKRRERLGEQTGMGPAQARLDKRAVEVRERMTPPVVGSLTVAAICALHFKDRAVQDGKTWEEKQRAVKAMLARLPHKIKVRELNRRVVKEYREARLHDRWRSNDGLGKLITPRTVNADIGKLQSILNWAVEEEHIEANPIAGLRALAGEVKRDRVMAPWEYEAMMADAATPQHLRDALALNYRLPLRKAEVFKLLVWGDTLQLERGPLGSIVFGKEGATKSGRARIVPLIYPELREMLMEQPSRFTGGRVFTFRGEPVHNVRTAWANAKRRAGITDLTWHDLKHTAYTNLREFMPGWLVAYMADHADESMADTYLNVQEQNVNRALEGVSVPERAVKVQ